MKKLLLFSILLFLASFLAVFIPLSRFSHSPQSYYIGVLSYEADGNVLRRVRVADGDAHILATFSGVAYADGVWWSPDGRLLATAAWENHDIKRIFHVDKRGRITPQASVGWNYPSLSPDHQQLAILGRGQNAETVLSVMDIDGSNRVEFDLETLGNPIWSPDGQWIAFSDGQIYRVRPDGTDLQALTPATMTAIEIAWSPDSQWIAFGGIAETIPVSSLGTADVFIVHTNGSQMIQLTADIPNVRAPTWSPDGSMIAFSGGKFPHLDIYRIKLDNKAITNLTGNENEAISPQWSPDGERIAFLAFDKQSGCPLCYYAVYIMNADGSNQRQLTVGVPVTDFAWSPLNR